MLEARALARLGDAKACDRALAAAVTEYERRKPENDPYWFQYFNEAELSAELALVFALGRSAACLRRCGHLPGNAGNDERRLRFQGSASARASGRPESACPDGRLGWRSPMVVIVRDVPWWGLVSSAVAPVLLVGGWTVAARLQPGSFDAVTGTISALAARGAADRWVMTLALAGVGACHVITGLALRPAASAGRLLLMTGGAATMLVAAFPETAGDGGSPPHTFWAAVGFVALAVWPIAARRRGPLVPAWVRPGACAGAAGVLLALLVWFGAELAGGGRQVGLAERVLAGAQAVWPLAVVLACRRSQSPARTRRKNPASADIPD